MAHDDPTPRALRRDLTVDQYFAGVRARDLAILSRALTLVESANAQHQLLAEELLNRLMPHTGGAIRVGISGTPGSGKSTFIEALGTQLVGTQLDGAGHRVAVLAIDPSSGVTGGSILGDKTRMAGLAADPNAYIRPSPSAGTLGGVARKTRESMLVCEAAGYDIILIETVGVGQSETYVADMTDSFVALTTPGQGDELQGIKRGLLEVVDFLVINKADGENKQPAELAARQYRTALESIAGRGPEGTSDGAPQVFTCSALHHEGVDQVWTAIAARHAAMQQDGRLTDRRQKQNLRWLWSIIEDRLRQSLYAHPKVQTLRAALEQKVLTGELPVESAARQLLDAYSAPNP